MRKQNLYGLSGTTVTSAAQTIDSLAYTYATPNQLSKVADGSSMTAGFNDGANATTEYTYDTHGNLTADQNKAIDSIKYNVLGKASRIKFHDGRVIVYTYDAAGTKLKMATTISGTTTTIDYVNGFVYTNSALSFFSSPEGRVVKNGSNYEYQYAIADHQGNTRVLFTSATASAQTITATFETSAQTTEAGNFQNYPSGSGISPVSAHNHTASGSKSQYLNGGYLGQVGVSKSYKVFPGDQLKIEAYGSYVSQSGSTNLTGFAATLLNAFALPTPAGGEVGTASAAINTWGGIEAVGWADGTTDNTDPKAFVNIIIFDKNYKFLDVTFAQVSSSGAPVYLSANYTIKEAGYAFLYVSNENATAVDVYFDDITMTYTPTKILQSNEYYPFGLQTANSWTRDNSSNNFLYDAGSELNSTSGFYDLAYRNYDAAVGRFFQVDPLSHKDHNLTPYHYAGNNPIAGNDPTGLMRQYVPEREAVINLGNHLDTNIYLDWYIDIGGGSAGNVNVVNTSDSGTGVVDQGGNSANNYSDSGVLDEDALKSGYNEASEFGDNSALDFGTTDYAWLTQLDEVPIEASREGAYTFGAVGWAPFDYEQYKWGIQTVANYRMDVNINVYQVSIYNAERKAIGNKWRVTVSATSYVSGAGAPVRPSARISLIGGSEVLANNSLEIEGDALIPGGGQYTYIGQASFDLPDIGSLQIRFTGGWVIQYDQTNRFVPINIPYLGTPIGVDELINIYRH